MTEIISISVKAEKKHLIEKLDKYVSSSVMNRSEFVLSLIEKLPPQTEEELEDEIKITDKQIQKLMERKQHLIEAVQGNIQMTLELKEARITYLDTQYEFYKRHLLRADRLVSRGGAKDYMMHRTADDRKRIGIDLSDIVDYCVTRAIKDEFKAAPGLVIGQVVQR